MNVQTAITKSAFAICITAESLLKTDKIEKEQMIQTCTDPLCLLGHANASLSLHKWD